jgi:hypothetical protein
MPWAEDFEGWQRSVKEDHPEILERLVRRTVWDSSAEARVLIDVVECSSAEDALKAFLDCLHWNQLAQLDEGPEWLGGASFMHPEGVEVPPSLFFARGNLCISAISFGKKYVDIMPWAERLKQRLDEIPNVGHEHINLRVESTTIKVGQEVVLEHTLRWKFGDEAYQKFLVRSGTLILKDTRLILTGSEPGEIKIEVYLLEPGREPHKGSLIVRVE